MKLTIATLSAFALLVLSPHSASAQVGYDATKKLVQLGPLPADATGTAAGNFTLPSDATDGFEVIASGFDPADQPRSVLADVTTGSALGAPASLELASGRPVSVQLAAATAGPGGSTVHVTASGFKPNSTVNFSVRYTLPSTEGVGGSSLPLTGSDIGMMLAVAAAVLLIGTAFVTSSKKLRKVS